MTPARIVLVGSGPTGLAAARVLAEAGLPLLWLEAGEEAPPPVPHTPDRLAAARLGAPGGWRDLLGDDLRGARAADLRSPKLRLAVGDAFTAGFARDTLARSENFAAIGTLAAGGLARIWGAFCPTWDAAETGGLDLGESYARVAAWMRLAGDPHGPLATWMGGTLASHPPLPLSPLFGPVWRRTCRQSVPGFVMDRALLAVNPAACDGCGACLWGCRSGAVWDGGAERARLCALPNVEWRPGTVVERLEAVPAGTRLLCRDATGHRFAVDSTRVVLAAGALASTKLVLDRLQRWERPVRLLTAPALSFAALAPARLGAPLPRSVHGLAQLCFRQDLPDGYAFGMLYDAAALPAPDLAQALPLSRAGAVAATRLLMPALAVGFLYLPGRFSDNRLSVELHDGLPRLAIAGGVTIDHAAAVRAAVRGVARGLRPSGLWLLPGSVRPSPPGAECHYGGTLAEFAADGQVAPGLFVVDASVLPGMAARHHTFTAMANADRLARRIAGIIPPAE